MDPVTQGALGAAAAQSFANGKRSSAAMLAGWLGGMAADLDVLIRSSSDPLLFLEYHRHFTHSLLFIPVGGLLVALFVHLCIGRRRQWAFISTLGFCTAGYATHALLDGCTSYGTMLLWPFSDTRYAWDTISIIDPLFTLPIIALLVLSVSRRNPWPARVGLCWALMYVNIGFFQHERALQAGQELAQSRGHSPLRLEAKPGFANLLLFKTIYRTDSHFYVDAVRVALNSKHYTGDSIAILNIQRDLPWLPDGSQQAEDLRRFEWFSDGYVALHPTIKNEVIDIRYSMLPQHIDPLWGITLSPSATPLQHAAYVTHRESSAELLNTYWQMIRGRDL